MGNDNEEIEEIIYFMTEIMPKVDFGDLSLHDKLVVIDSMQEFVCNVKPIYAKYLAKNPKSETFIVKI